MARRIANIYRRDDGTYQLRFTVDGKRYAVYGKTVDECRQKETQKRQEIEQGAYQRQTDRTLREYADRWLSGKDGTIKDATYRSYSAQRTRIGRHRIADVRLRDLRPQHVRDLIRDMSAELSPGTVNLTLVSLRAVLKSAVHEDLIQKNPADGIKRLRDVKKPSETSPHRALTREETAAFLQAAEARRDAYRYLYRLMLHTGLRIGEAIALTDEEVHDDHIDVVRTMTTGRTGELYLGDTPKTSTGIRVIPLDVEARDAIRRQQEIRDALGVTGTIFRSPRGAMGDFERINDSIARTCKLAGIAPFTSHAFRDTFATRCAEARMQPHVLMELMGHANIAVTMRYYVHVMDDVKAKQFASVDFGT